MTKEKLDEDQIIQGLLIFFDDDYNLLPLDFRKYEDSKTLAEEKIVLNKNQFNELLIIPLMANVIAVISAFGVNAKSHYILDKVLQSILGSYFEDKDANEFQKLFLTRYAEYSNILNSETIDVSTSLSFGKRFCNHFFNAVEDGRHVEFIFFIRGVLSYAIISRKKFIDNGFYKSHEGDRTKHIEDIKKVFANFR